MKARKLLASLVALVMALPLAGCGQSAAQYDVSSIGPKIHVGVSFDQPGLGFVQSGDHQGFDVDVAKYVVHELGYSHTQIVWQEVRPVDRERMLVEGKVDLVVAGYSITRARQELVDFAGPYLLAGQDLLVRREQNEITGVDSLDSKRVCVARGSSTAEVVSRHAPNAQVEERDQFTECITALLSGDADAVGGDDFALAGLAKVRGGNQLRLVGAPFTQEHYGIAVRKDDPELVATINAALEKMMSEGAWKQALTCAARSIGLKTDPAARRPDRLDGAPSQE